VTLDLFCRHLLTNGDIGIIVMNMKKTTRLAINLTGKDATLALTVKAAYESRLGVKLNAVQIGAIAFKALADKEGVK
jgi:hypothetical protein